MNSRTAYALVALLAAAGTLTISSAYALEEACPDCDSSSVQSKAASVLQQDLPISVWTDKSAYGHGDMIKVQGKVANVAIDTPVTLTVTNPTNNVVTIAQLSVDNEGNFATTLNTAGSLWKSDGTFIIKVQYGNQAKSDKALVQISGGQMASSSTSCAANQVAAGDQCIPYSIEGGVVTSASLNPSGYSVVINVKATDDGKITLNPSTSTINGIFMVLVDGEEWDDVEINGNQVTVMFPAGTEKIEILGTFVVPEFGSIAALILVVAIVSVIAVSARSRLSLMPKF